MLDKVLSTFRSSSVVRNNTQFKYIPVALGDPDCLLENLLGISIEGMAAIKMSINLVEPKLVLEKA